jgi:hypothetical protein
MHPRLLRPVTAATLTIAITALLLPPQRAQNARRGPGLPASESGIHQAITSRARALAARQMPLAIADQNRRTDIGQWPAISQEAKPWTRWWWHGSAVDPASLTRQLEALRDAGIGGVEITPIYGVRGDEAEFIPFLSDQWLRMLQHTLREASRLDLGVDMATGTGWPFGGPWVGDDTSSRTIAHRTWTLAQGERLAEPVRLRQAPLVRAAGTVPSPGAPRGTRPIQIADLVEPLTANPDLQALALEQVRYPRDLPLIVLMAYSDGGQAIDLTPRVGRNGSLDWDAPAGRWTLHALFLGWHGKLVERAAPGGEGPVIDHFSPSAIRQYLARFDRAFAGHNTPGLRAFFNDSYEVDDATGQGDGTPSLLDEFQRRRGYDLRRYLPALLGRDTEDRNARVLADYRETISDLLLDTFTAEWGSWAHGRNTLVRNQAHGSPASILDLYAASDIPETEGDEIRRFKWATSAGHVAGRRLVSAEAATWLGEHFRSTLADVRAAVDRFFVAGVNHIVYHGTAYSPESEPWPGRLFYAAVEFSPTSPWWDDFGALNRYVARVQSFLQTGRPDHDVLLYYPLYDQLAVPGSALLTHFGGANEPLTGTAFEEASALMQRRGFTYDFISDRQLRSTRVNRGRLITAGGGPYKVLVIPAGRFIPLETFEHVLSLARDGALVVSLKGWPSDISGLGDLETRRERFRRAAASVRFGPADAGRISEARLGRGRIFRGDDLERLLGRAGIARERLVDDSLQFARRTGAGGRLYFISNTTDRMLDGFVPLDVRSGELTVFDPMRGYRGRARVRRSPAGTFDAFLQFLPGESLVVMAGSAPAREDYPSYRAAGSAVEIQGPWTIRFVTGGPALPAARTLARLASWTTLGGDDLKAFSGTAEYTTRFPRPAGAAAAWRLDLARVKDSARVRLNGRELATLLGPAFLIRIDAALLSAENVLEVLVTNLSANRIADLDRRGVPWKKFYNVNFAARLAENRGPDGLFTAERWEPLDSGLIGPVTLTPLAAVR